MVDGQVQIQPVFYVLSAARNVKLFLSLSLGSKSNNCLSLVNQSCPLFYIAFSSNIYPLNEQLFLLTVYFASLSKQNPPSLLMRYLFHVPVWIHNRWVQWSKRCVLAQMRSHLCFERSIFIYSSMYAFLESLKHDEDCTYFI